MLGALACGGSVTAPGQGGGGAAAQGGNGAVASSGGRGGWATNETGGVGNAAGGSLGTAGAVADAATGGQPGKEGDCASNEVLCAVSCVDLSRDPNHCGRCFKVCAGKCAGGVCEP
ncbi:MAG TPA: hypothetical protein VHE30_11615 [Polyangiaceae bacterium]|nr:hypothetical protein [Polyangiaceae bacterium]